MKNETGRQVICWWQKLHNIITGVYVPGEYKKITVIVNKSIQIIFEKDYVKMWRLTFHIKLSLV